MTHPERPVGIDSELPEFHTDLGRLLFANLQANREHARSEPITASRLNPVEDPTITVFPGPIEPGALDFS